MAVLKIGDLFAINNHPFPSSWDNTDGDKKKSVLIGADASFIPPIMVVSETMNCNGEHDSDTGIKQVNQVRGIFYSHRTHKFELHWFKMNEIRKIENEKFSNSSMQFNNLESLQNLKTDNLNKIVILRNIDVEINKEKISQERKNFDSISLKRSPYLNFVPPVMSVIDIRTAESPKDNFYKNSGRKKRLISKFDLKCKYYNPNSFTYSEEWMPSDCLVDITENFDIASMINLKDKFRYYTFEKPLKLEDSDISQIGTIVYVKELIFNHYEYLLKSEDIWNHKVYDIKNDHSILSEDDIDVDDLMYPRIPNKTVHYPLPSNKFKEDCLYEIEYLSDRGNATKRLIYVTEKRQIMGAGDEVDTLIIANCLLRSGKIRHFKVSNIKSSKKLKSELKNKIIKRIV